MELCWFSRWPNILGTMIEKQFCIEFIDELLMKSHCGGRPFSFFPTNAFPGRLPRRFFLSKKCCMPRGADIE